MNVIETYGKEIVSLLAPLLTWTLNRFFKGNSRLQIAQTHKFTFLVQEPLLDPSGNQVQSAQTVHTNSYIIRIAGRSTATNIELVFNWKPMCLNIWPPRHFTEHQEPDKRHVLIFESLSPDEVLGCEVLSVNLELPNLVTVRSDQCVAQFIAMYPQPIVSKPIRTLVMFLLTIGLAATVYCAILLLQFLVLKTPF